MAAIPVGVSIGRVRRTRVVSPSEAGYITSMNRQAQALTDKILQVAQNVGDATPDAILFALQPIYERSQELVPVRTGKLKSSGFLTIITTTANNVKAAIGYARYGQPHYAAFVHEMVHIPHAKGTQAKFLEAAVNEKIFQFERRLTNYLRNAGGFANG